jgi:hypothetical protein
MVHRLRLAYMERFYLHVVRRGQTKGVKQETAHQRESAAFIGVLHGRYRRNAWYAVFPA